MKNNISQISSEKCFGCRVCEQICPKKCISITENSEGFLFPIINTNCVECGICIKHCPAANSEGLLNRKAEKAYALFSKDKNILQKSASGGLFYNLAKSILKDNGVVFGASYDENLFVSQIMVRKIEDLWKLQGSKYVACDTLNSFSEVKKLLDNKNTVFYSGSPCQIAGLYSFLEENNIPNLYTCDIVCHGTPSQKCFQSYLNYLGKKENSKVIKYAFRDKSVHPLGAISYEYTNGKKKKQRINVFDPYGVSFSRHENYKLSCYTCPFARNERIGDITIGDFWGIEKFEPSFSRENGVSLAIPNTEKGFRLLQTNLNNFNYVVENIDNALKYNKNLNEPELKPQCRDTFYKKMVDNKFWDNIETYSPIKYYYNQMIVRIVRFFRNKVRKNK